MPRNHGKANKERKRAEAIVRQEAYDNLSTEEKVAQLNKVFGKDIGAKRQRARLANLLQLEQTAKEQPTPLPSTHKKFKK
jgi:hypothetical protein